MNTLPEWLILCIWRALLGEIYPSVRAIAIKLSEGNLMLIRYYLENEPTEIDYESIETVATNISASIGLEKIKKIDVDCQYSNLPFGKLDCLDGLIYCRREYEL